MGRSRDRGGDRGRGGRSRTPPRRGRSRSPPRKRARSPTPKRRSRSPPRKRARSPSRRRSPPRRRVREESPYTKNKRERSRSKKKVKFEKDQRVEARDTGKAWQQGVVTCVNPLRVKLDSELSGCGWDEVRHIDDSKPKAVPAEMADIMQKIKDDAQKLLDDAKEEALNNLKAAVEGVRLLSSLESPTAAAFKEAKMRVATAIKSAKEKGVSAQELIEASSAMGKSAKEPESEEEQDDGKGGTIKVKKKKAEAEVVFENPAVGEAGRVAAEQAKEEGKTVPEIVVAAFTAAKAVEGATAEDLKKVKKVAAATALDGSSSTSSSSSEEEEEKMTDAEKAKAKREAIAAVFYFDAKK